MLVLTVNSFRSTVNILVLNKPRNKMKGKQYYGTPCNKYLVQHLVCLNNLLLNSWTIGDSNNPVIYVPKGEPKSESLSKIKSKQKIVNI